MKKKVIAWLLAATILIPNNGIVYAAATPVNDQCYSETSEKVENVDTSSVQEDESASNSGNCGVDVKWEYDSTSKELVISGNGSMADYPRNTLPPWEDFKDEISKITIAPGVTYIGQSAFVNCYGLKTVVLGESVQTIGEKAFAGCYKLEDIIINGDVETIENVEYISYVFSGVQVLKVGSKVTRLNEEFCKIAGLRAVEVDSGNAFYQSENGVLFNKQQTELIKYPEHKTDITYTIPETVTTIKKEAFYDNDHLQRIEFPKDLQTIEEGAFKNCDALQSVFLRDKVESVGRSAFNDCYGLESVVLGSGVKTIGGSAFAFCRQLKNITVNSDVEEMDDTAFDGMDAYDRVLKVGQQVNGLNEAFYDMLGLAVIEVDAENEVYQSEDGVLFNKGKTELIRYPQQKSDIAYEIPETVTAIRANGFDSAENLESVLVNGNVATVGKDAFSNTYVRKLQVGSKVSRLNAAFYELPKLTAIEVDEENMVYQSENGVLFNKGQTELIKYLKRKPDTTYEIPETVTTIAKNAFYECTNLESITVNGNVESVEYGAFSGTSVQKLQVGRKVHRLNANFYEFRDLSEIEVDSGNAVYSSVNGVLFDREQTELIKYPRQKTYAIYTVPKTVTAIKEKAFYGSEYLEQIKFPEKLKIIEAEAFWSNDKLEKIEFPEDLEIIGDQAFYNCTLLKSVVIPSSVTKIGVQALGYAIWEDMGDFTIYGRTGSEAERYAKENGFKFVSNDPKKNLETAVVTVNNQVYTGKKLSPEVTVKLDGVVLTKDKDYTLTYTKNVNVGTANVTVTGMGNYIGSKKVSFKILPKETTVKLTLYGHDDVKVSWNRVDGQVTGYKVYYRKVGASSWTTKGEYDYTETSVTLPNLADGTQYEVAVKTFTIADGVEYYASYKPVSIWTLKSTSVKLELYGHDDVKVSWGKVNGASGYKVYYRKAGTSSWTTKGYYTGTSVTLPNLTDGVKYEVAVRPYKTVGSTKYYAPYTPVCIYALKATTTKLALYGHDDVKVSWNKINGASGYKVYYRKAGTSSWTTKGYYTGTSVTLPNLTDGKKYEVAVRPYKTEGSTKHYAPYKAVSIYALSRVATPKVSKYSSTKVNVSWGNIPGETGYQISQSTSKTATKIVYTYQTTSAKSKTITAKRGVTYYYKVRAYRTEGTKKIYGPWSEVAKYKR